MVSSEKVFVFLTAFKERGMFIGRLKMHFEFTLFGHCGRWRFFEKGSELAYGRVRFLGLRDHTSNPEGTVDAQIALQVSGH
jgi:hypothetical protein